MAWERTQRMRLNPTVVPWWFWSNKNVRKVGIESLENGGITGKKWGCFEEITCFGWFWRFRRFFEDCNQKQNAVAKRQGWYTQHLGLPIKQVSIYVKPWLPQYMPCFKIRSVSCVSSNFFIEQTGCFCLPYQISRSEAVSFGTSFSKKPQRWQRSLWCWPSMQGTTVCPPMMTPAS